MSKNMYASKKQNIVIFFFLFSFFFSPAELILWWLFFFCCCFFWFSFCSTFQVTTTLLEPTSHFSIQPMLLPVPQQLLIRVENQSMKTYSTDNRIAVAVVVLIKTISIVVAVVHIGKYWLTWTKSCLAQGHIDEL